ncbi:SusC/RagA family TonB-linked outer membrane protein [Cytophagaceae bacterium YF14B1]|uniref:SusC/RagA family TonB-linked outer membrane protein n=1 Tax=Xanthocytophaga flava TaxID=3048013 RepID=A0AAE3UAP6_9BACT|nr:SusC/RagA family TonB-linked outer membrane protein [Xanthocytophaga flavus]MDJ1482974.1 SusC/RagA family TonB-linked outer membrane protein [Xanthocytophaga flavus]
MKKKRIVGFLQTTMRIAIAQTLLVTVFTCTTFANTVLGQTLDQSVSLSVKNAELRDVLKQIQAQTRVRFVYSPNSINVDQKVSVQAANEKLDVILKEVLSTLDIQFKLVKDRVILSKNPEPAIKAQITSVIEQKESALIGQKAAPIVVSGKVTDDKKDALPGVSVLIKGTTIGTTTDGEGNYRLSIPEEYSKGALVFSFIGFTSSEVPINNQTTINVALVTNVKSLNEVVVTGYQEIRKESFTGTAITISGDDLKKVNPLNFLQSLQTFDPSFRITQDNTFGSNPNKLPDITVRGASGLPSSSSGTQSDDNSMSRRSLATNPNLPTFILNGFQVGIQTIYDLDWNRVESITLLKDAAATAVYGSRAANGVVVITTKKPKEGQLRFSYNYDMSVTGPDLTVYNVLDARDKLEYERLAGLYTSKQAYQMTDDEAAKLYYQKKYTVESGVNTYWLSEPVKTALEHNNSLSLEGGSNVLQYNLTARYQTLKGVMKGSGRNRFGADVNLAYNIDNKFFFTNNLSVTNVVANESPYGKFEDYIRMNPYYAKKDANGNLIREVDSWNTSGIVNNDGDQGLVVKSVLNPAYDASLSSFDKSAYTQIINSFAVNWNIASGINLRGQLSIAKQRTASDIFKSPLSNEFYSYKGDDLKKRGRYTYGGKDETTLDGNMVLSFNKAVSSHFVNASLGTNLRDYSNDYKDFTVMGFANDKFDNVGLANRYSDDDKYRPTGYQSTERLLGAFAAVNYSLSDKYLLDLNARLDGSSKFGTKNKFAPFWAAGIGWNLHKEGFLIGSPVINQLKLRASTGLTGEVSFEPFLARTTYEYYSDWYSSGAGAVYKAYGNESLKWQRTRNYDLGMELQLLKGMIYISPRYYYKLTQDLLADIVVPPSAGFSSYKANLGFMENKGWELNLRSTLIKKKNWDLSVFVNMTHNTNTIKKISESLKKYNDEIDKQQENPDYQGTPLLRYKEGESINSIYAVQSLGIDPENGKEIFVKKDGSLTYIYSVKDIVRVGDTSPDAEGFFGGTLSVKNFFLTVNFYTKFGGDLYNQTLVDRIENADPRYNVDKRVLTSRWKQPGDHALFKDITDWNSTRASSRFIQKDNVIELRSVNLTYETPRSLAKRLHMQSLRFMVTTNDIWRWSAVKMERGIDFPFARTVSFSIQTRF